jgi:hypothetical protein
MNYTKPAVAVLGQASRVIEALHIKDGTPVFDPSSGTRVLNPAYDLDE